MHTTDTPRPTAAALFWRHWVRPLLVTAVALVVIRSSVIDWNIVPTGSMRPTIVEGDYILVNKLAYDVRVPLLGWRVVHGADPQRDDIIIFEPPGLAERYVKRVIGVPGDVVHMHDHRLYVNGRPTPTGHEREQADSRPAARLSGVPAWFASQTRGAVLQPADLSAEPTFGPVVVPTGHYFVLGDNRGNSKDSRSFGFVAREKVLGKAVRVLASVDPDLNWQPRVERFLHTLA